MVNSPYGAYEIVEEWVSPGDLDFMRIEANITLALDAEKIGLGAYTPLRGFMSEGEFISVVKRMRLLNDLPWTIPIIFPPRRLPRDLKVGDEVLITHGGEPVALLNVEDIFKLDKGDLASSVYGTKDPGHPNVAEILHEFGEVSLGGRVRLVGRVQHSLSIHELTPRLVREELSRRGFGTVTCFQCRNPPHRGHEYMQRIALELTDGLVIHPVLGKLKVGDYRPEIIFYTYDYFIKNYYPVGRVLLTPLLISMRYAGPRAAVFLAIIRRNYGCTHMIVGRDIAGVNNYYNPYAAHELLSGLKEELGMEFLFFTEAFYCRRCGQVVTERSCGHDGERISISQTAIRKHLTSGYGVADEVMRHDVLERMLELGKELGGLFVEQ